LSRLSYLVKRAVTYKTAFLAFALVFAGVALTADSGSVCRASASHTAPYQYCYETRISITNSGTTDQTDVPVRVLFPASELINSYQLDERGWDLLPIAGDLDNEIYVQQQSLSSSQAPYWLIVPDLPAGATRDVAFYTANDTVRLDNAIYFTGSEYLSVTDHADFDITDDLQIDIGLRNMSDTARSQILVEHRTQASSEGYRVQLEDFGSALYVTFVVDSAVCRLAWDSSWTGEIQRFSFRYEAAAGVDTYIDRNGSNATSCDIDQGTIATTSENVLIGARASTLDFQLADVAIHGVEILEAGVSAGRWGFDANKMSETNSTNPYLGTADDYSGNGHTANYTFDRDQSDYSFSIGTTHLVTLAPHLPDSETTNRVVGNPVPDDFSSTRTPVNSGIIYTAFVSRLEDVATATGVPSSAVIAGTFYILSFVLAAVVFRLTGYMPAVVLTMGIGPSMAVAMGYVEYWWLFIWGLTIAVVWLAQLRSQESS
jgi:hypothetical protein